MSADGAIREGTPSAREGPFRPAYLDLLENGELARRVERGRAHLSDCVLCARHCHVDRTRSIRGSACRIGVRAVLHGHHAHHGEEPCLRGTRGSGTIFVSSCNLRCLYCQNWQISQSCDGEPVDASRFAEIMLELQNRGCHNVNVVSPSHVVAQLLEAVMVAAERGLRLPLVYNTGGYDSPEGLALLDGVVDVYLPDMKYGDSRTARQYSHVRNYASVNRSAVKEMHRQVGDLAIDADGVARRGLLVRHLVLPGGLANTGRVLKFISEEISPDTHVNLMDQYYPAYRGFDYPPFNRPVTLQEYRRAVALAKKYGLRRLESHAPALA